MRAQNGYSLSELLVVVAILGVVTLVTIPALVQLMPQYRIRSASSEAAGAMRMVRQRAITTRTPWRISYDPASNKYRFYQLRATHLDLSDAASWRPIRRDGRTPDPMNEDYFRNAEVDLNASPAASFHDTTCPSDGMLDLIFLRDGSVADTPACGSTTKLSFTTSPGIVFAVDSKYVRFNRYYLTLSQTGRVPIRPAKE